MDKTTIKLTKETKKMLDTFREYKNETYDEVLAKIVHVATIARIDPNASKRIVESIENTRQRVKLGRYLNEEKALVRLGLKN